MVLKDVFELNDISMVKTFMNFDFWKKFDSLSTLSECSFRNNLCSIENLCFLSNDFIALCKSTTSKKLSSCIFFNCDFSSEFVNTLLFNDLCFRLIISSLLLSAFSFLLVLVLLLLLIVIVIIHLNRFKNENLFLIVLMN